MTSILVICPTHRDHRELAALELSGDIRFLFHDYASLALEDLVAAEPPPESRIADPLAEIERILDRYGGEDVTGVISTDDYPGSALACAVAARLGLATPDPAVNLVCQHKFQSRRLQRTFAPDAVPDFVLVDVHAEPPRSIRYPTFVKPVKSFFSVGARLIGSVEELRREQRRWAGADSFFRPFERLLERYVGLSIGCERLIAEAPLKGSQATLEGFVFGGEVQLVGIVDSIMFPDTISFQRFEYPSHLPDAVQERMTLIAKAVMTGIGYDNGMFNIEFMYDAVAGAVHIVEINPRMSSQFADLYEKVDGTNSYEVLLDLAVGKSPHMKRRRGTYRMAASCVLRCFENRTVLRTPSHDEVERLEERHPGIRVEILATQGRRLSQEMQDGNSYRYGIVSLGGDNRRDILRRLDDALRHLTFEFAKV